MDFPRNAIIFSLILTTRTFINAEVQSPLCQMCNCTNVPDNPPDVNCFRLGIGNIFLDRKYWLDQNNKTYPISSLSMQSNSITTLDVIFPDSNLTKLDLSHNYIQNISVNVFSGLENMVELILSYNNLERLNPDVFKGVQIDGQDYPLRSLKILWLDNNQFHSLNQDVFRHVDYTIEKLYLNDNPLKVIDQSTEIAITSLTYLKELYLDGTRLKELPQYFLHTPKYLQMLDLSNNEFDSIPETFGDAHTLETVYFNDNVFINLTAKNGFPKMDSLKVLRFCDNTKLVEIGAGALSGLISLEELHLCNNMDLVNIHPAALSRKDEENEVWPPLKKVFLQNNKLTYMDSHVIATWDRLRQLDITNNPWTCDCENQWMVDELVPIIARLDESLAKQVGCGAPIEMRGKLMFELHQKEYDMRCLDSYGHRPEKDASILVGILVGLLIGIPVILFALYAYQRHWFGLCDNSPASFSRQFYRTTRSDDL